MSAVNPEIPQTQAILPEYLEAVTVGGMRLDQMRCVSKNAIYVDKGRKMWLNPDAMTYDELSDGYSVTVERTSDGYEIDVSYVEATQALWRLEDPEEFEPELPYVKPDLIPVARLIDTNKQRNVSVPAAEWASLEKELAAGRHDT